MTAWPSSTQQTEKARRRLMIPSGHDTSSVSASNVWTHISYSISLSVHSADRLSITPNTSIYLFTSSNLLTLWINAHIIYIRTRHSIHPSSHFGNSSISQYYQSVDLITLFIQNSIATILCKTGAKCHHSSNCLIQMSWLNQSCFQLMVTFE